MVGAPGTLVATTAHADRFRASRPPAAARRMELNHPALIPLRAVGEYEGQPYLVTEPYPARTFDDLLEESPA